MRAGGGAAAGAEVFFVLAVKALGLEDRSRFFGRESPSLHYGAGRNRISRRAIYIDRVIIPFAKELAPVLLKMADQIRSLHAT